MEQSKLACSYFVSAAVHAVVILTNKPSCRRSLEISACWTGNDHNFDVYRSMVCHYKAHITEGSLSTQQIQASQRHQCCWVSVPSLEFQHNPARHLPQNQRSASLIAYLVGQNSSKCPTNIGPNEQPAELTNRSPTQPIRIASARPPRIGADQ